jgi:hypothetical protein
MINYLEGNWVRDDLFLEKKPPGNERSDSGAIFNCIIMLQFKKKKKLSSLLDLHKYIKQMKLRT